MTHKNKALVIAIGGLSGSGKSTLAARLYRDISSFREVEWLSSDKIRKEMWGVPETEKLPQDAYSRAFSKKVYKAIDHRARKAAQAGKIVIVDVVFATEFGRENVEKSACESKAGFLGLWLDAPVDVLADRVEHRVNDASDADYKIVNLQMNFDLGRISWKRLDASQGREKIYNQVCDLIKTKGLEFSSKNTVNPSSGNKYSHR